MGSPTQSYIVPIKPPHGAIIYVRVEAWDSLKARQMAEAQVSGGTVAGPVQRVG